MRADYREVFPAGVRAMAELGRAFATTEASANPRTDSWDGRSTGAASRAITGRVRGAVTSVSFQSHLLRGFLA